MKDLVGWSYNIDASDLVQLNMFYYLEEVTTYLYIIPAGKEKNTVFFHLLKFIDRSPYFTLLLTRENETTITMMDTQYYGLRSNLKLHDPISTFQLNVPILYPATYPIASHFKSRWLAKNQIHEQELGLALDKVPSQMRALLFDLATYYIHLNEEAYPLMASLESINFTVSLCHARLKPERLLIEFFMPEHLILDNRSRLYCEYIRHLFVTTGDLSQVKEVVATIVKNDPLLEEEWRFLYARLYFPSHFYDMVYDLLHNDEVNLASLYEETLNYAKLLSHLPQFIYEYTGIRIPVSEWVTQEGHL